MNQRRSCTFVFAILGSFLIYPPDPSTSKASKIDQLVSEYQQCGYFNGSILVAEHGKVLYQRGVGYADIQTHTTNTPKTKFGIASLSKQFTAALVLMQVAIGNLRLDATFSKILPWYRKDTGSRINIEQLLRHTSGLPPDYDAPEFDDGEAAARHAEPEMFARSVCQPALVSEPGTRWNYSNCGYTLLGPNFGLAHNQLAQAYLQKQNSEEAIAELRKAIQLSGDCPTCTANLARAYVVVGKRDEALKLLSDLKKGSNPV